MVAALLLDRKIYFSNLLQTQRKRSMTLILTPFTLGIPLLEGYGLIMVRDKTVGFQVNGLTCNMYSWVLLM